MKTVEKRAKQNSFLYRVIRRFRIEYEFYKFARKSGQPEGYMGRYREYQRKCNDL